MLKSCLGWGKEWPVGAMVMCRKLRNKGLHTFIGMIGYCIKDSDQSHFQTIDHNITAATTADIALSLEQYSLYGKEESKNRVVLIMTNIVDRVFQWRRFNGKHPLVVDFNKDLYDMIKTGKYYPSASWVVGVSGRGYEPYRMQSLYKMMVCPVDTSRTHISNVFEMPDIYKQLDYPRRQWFGERFRDDNVIPSAAKALVKRALFTDFECSPQQTHAKEYKVNTYVDNGDVGEVQCNQGTTTPQLEVLCAAALQNYEEIAKKIVDKDKRKMYSSPTRHLWPQEWAMDKCFSSSTDNSFASDTHFVLALPADVHIPLYTRRGRALHIS